MDREQELRALAGVLQRLSERFPDLDPALVEAAVRVSHHELRSNPIRDFVPLLVEHAARDRLAFALDEPRTVASDPPPLASAPSEAAELRTATVHRSELAF